MINKTKLEKNITKLQEIKEKEETQTIKTVKEPNTEIKKYYAVILRVINGTLYKIGEKKIKNTAKNVSFENRTYPIKSFNVAFVDKGKSYLFFDYEGQVLDFNKTKIPISVDELDELIEKNIIVGFFSKINKAFEKMEISGVIFKYLLVAIAFSLIGYIIGNVIPFSSTSIINPSNTNNGNIPTVNILINLIGGLF